MKMPVNRDAEKNDPCLKERNISYKCLSNNNFERSKCELHFLNYQQCKSFWNQVRLDRRAKGVEPNVPRVEERDAIKAEYMKSKISS